MPESSILDERLAEIDRRLRTIQSGLVSVHDEPPAGEPAAGAGEPATGAGEPATGAGEPATGTGDPPVDASGPSPAAPASSAPGSGPARRAPEPLRLVEPAPRGDESRLSDLVEAHERLLELHRELLSQYAEVLERRAGESATVAVNAGPFTSASGVREFERALAALPGVHAVTVREYVGDDRVQVDVRLSTG
ncbi:MAG TPA: hypothetical protein VFN65_09815 [Solirubrobacteraceae bacterium]|nr:hypothetical protein [Solirubrobacteraceae bacterium]